ncbi:MAG: hypothetical protein ACLFUJ_07095 [Phycisphaerae bacterium]
MKRSPADKTPPPCDEPERGRPGDAETEIFAQRGDSGPAFGGVDTTPAEQSQALAQDAQAEPPARRLTQEERAGFDKLMEQLGAPNAAGRPEDDEDAGP